MRMTEREYAAMTGQKPKTNKYRNKPCELDGHKFPSLRERDRYAVLKLMECAGVISGLRLQVPYKLPGCKYVADFVYVESGRQVIEDAKGCRTAVYKLKMRLMKEAGYEVKEV